MSADVTIVIATYNRPEMLRVELHSILASAAMVPESVRILIVDDGSPNDATEAVAHELGIPSTDYVRLPENRGVAGALAAGFAEVDSEYYALWGDDDYFLPRWFPLHLAKIREGYDVVAGSYWMADAHLALKDLITLPVATLEDLRVGRVMCNDGALVRRDSLGDIAFRPERERAMMLTFWLAMADAGKRFAVIDEPTWLYRRHEGQLTARKLSRHDRALREKSILEYAAMSRQADGFG